MVLLTLFILLSGYFIMKEERKRGAFIKPIGDKQHALFDAYGDVDEYLFDLDTYLRMSLFSGLDRYLVLGMQSECGNLEDYPLIYKRGELCEKFTPTEVHKQVGANVEKSFEGNYQEIQTGNFWTWPVYQTHKLVLMQDNPLQAKLTFSSDLTIKSSDPKFKYRSENPSSQESIDFNLSRYLNVLEAVRVNIPQLEACIKAPATGQEKFHTQSCFTKHIKTPLENLGNGYEYIEEKNINLLDSFIQFYQTCHAAPKSDCTCFYIPPVLQEDQVQDYELTVSEEGGTRSSVQLEGQEKQGFPIPGPYSTEVADTELSQSDVTIHFYYTPQGRVSLIELEWTFANWDVPGVGLLLYRDANGKIKFVDTDEYGTFFQLPDCGVNGQQVFRISMLDKHQRYISYDRDEHQYRLKNPLYKFAMDLTPKIDVSSLPDEEAKAPSEAQKDFQRLKQEALQEQGE
jgi:hypothetical protein